MIVVPSVLCTASFEDVEPIGANEEDVTEAKVVPIGAGVLAGEARVDGIVEEGFLTTELRNTPR